MDIDIVRLKVIMCVARRRWKKVLKNADKTFSLFGGWMAGCPANKFREYWIQLSQPERFTWTSRIEETIVKKRGVVAFCIKVDRNYMKFLSPDLPCFHFLMHAHFNFFQHVIFVIRWYRLFVVTWHQFRQSLENTSRILQGAFLTVPPKFQC